MNRITPLLAGFLMPAMAFAQAGELPEYAYDMVAEISMATTAASTCDGAKLNNKKLQDAMVAMMGKLAGDGLDPVASVKHFETPAGQERISLREAAFRARHGVSPDGAEALCTAIRAEVKTNKSLAKLVKLR